nr:O-methyltransferase [Hamadaea tsunoensis]
MTQTVPVKNTVLTPELHSYVLSHCLTPDPLLDDLAAQTRTLIPGQAHMMVAPEQGALLTLLVRLLQARAVVEVGTFTGYSSLCLARGLPLGGTLTTCELSADYAAVARAYWERAGVDDRISLRVGPALDSLRALPSVPHVDLAFIDADKPGYIAYWEELVPRMVPGGLIIVDNTLFNGEVLDADPAPKPAAVAAFNRHALADPRVERVMLPIADGVLLARRLSYADRPL